MIVKVDLEKAYDQIDLNFLEKILETIGLFGILRQVVMNCIKSTNLSVIWNGVRLEAFKPERGLRQGDPLSPYLFVLYMETLNRRIS